MEDGQVRRPVECLHDLRRAEVRGRHPLHRFALERPEIGEQEQQSCQSRHALVSACVDGERGGPAECHECGDDGGRSRFGRERQQLHRLSPHGQEPIVKRRGQRDERPRRQYGGSTPCRDARNALHPRLGCDEAVRDRCSEDDQSHHTHGHELFRIAQETDSETVEQGE